jgi:hypothetical protein
MPVGRRFHFLDERCPLGFLFLRLPLALVLHQQHLAKPDTFDDALGHDAHLLPLKGVIEEEYVWLLEVEKVDLAQLGN